MPDLVKARFLINGKMHAHAESISEVGHVLKVSILKKNDILLL